MGLSNVVILCLLIIFFTLICTNTVQCKRRTSKEETQRPTRGFNNMVLGAARNFGKRAVNMDVVNSILMELFALEREKMRQLRLAGDLPEDELDENLAYA